MTELFEILTDIASIIVLIAVSLAAGAGIILLGLGLGKMLAGL